MKLYFDIDGVLVGRGRKSALYVTEFLKMATEKHDCYWATTHCKGDATDDIMRYIKEILPVEAVSCCEKIKQTNWSHQKTEAIDLSSEFLWFEDAPSDIEKEILAKNGKSASLVIVDLITNPNHLKELIKLL